MSPKRRNCRIETLEVRRMMDGGGLFGFSGGVSSSIGTSDDGVANVSYLSSDLRNSVQSPSRQNGSLESEITNLRQGNPFDVVNSIDPFSGDVPGGSLPDIPSGSKVMSQQSPNGGEGGEGNDGDTSPPPRRTGPVGGVRRYDIDDAGSVVTSGGNGLDLDTGNPFDVVDSINPFFPDTTNGGGNLPDTPGGSEVMSQQSPDGGEGSNGNDGDPREFPSTVEPTDGLGTRMPGLTDDIDGTGDGGVDPLGGDGSLDTGNPFDVAVTVDQRMRDAASSGNQPVTSTGSGVTYDGGEGGEGDASDFASTAEPVDYTGTRMPGLTDDIDGTGGGTTDGEDFTTGTVASDLRATAERSKTRRGSASPRVLAVSSPHQAAFDAVFARFGGMTRFSRRFR